MSINKINSYDKLEGCLNVLHKAYEVRDKELGLDDSIKKHTFITFEELKSMYDNGIQMYAYYVDNTPVAFLSFDIRDNEIKIKDIVVLPEYQKSGIGTTLLEYLKKYSNNIGINKIVLGMLYTNTKLRLWYEKNGFNLVKTIQYPTSTVCIMECML